MLYRDNEKENGNYYLGFRVYSPPQVDRIWGIWGSYYTIPQAIFYLLNGAYKTFVRSGKHVDRLKGHGLAAPVTDDRMSDWHLEKP